MQTGPQSLIRTLYLFSLLGLILVTIGSVGFLNMGLRAFVFTQADGQEALYRAMPLRPYSIPEGDRMLSAEALSEVERGELRRHLDEARSWEARQKGIDPVASRRHRDAAQNLSLMLIGLPLYHWRVIRKETSSEKEAAS